MWDPYSKFQSAVLPNGVTIHAAEWNDRPWEMIGFIFHSGAEIDPVGREGLAHFTEHLVSNNGLIPKKEMKAFFKKYGGWLNFGKTSYTCTYYSLFAPNEPQMLSRAFFLLGHMLLFSTLNKSIEHERNVIIEEFNQHYPLPYQIELDTRKRKALYSDCWLGRSLRPLGNPQSVKNISEKDPQLFYDSNYVPANLSIIGIGGLSIDELHNLLCSSPFAGKKAGNRNPRPNPTVQVDRPLENRYFFKASEHNVQLTTAIYKSYCKIPGAIETPVSFLFQKMLNEVMYDETRGKNAWTYSITASTNNYRAFSELSVVSNSIASRAIDRIEQIVDDCISRAGNDRDLLEKVRNQSLAELKMLDMSAARICKQVMLDLNDDRISSLKEKAEDISHVTLEDVRDLAIWLRPEQRWTLILCP